jgi:hypothetical protein
MIAHFVYAEKMKSDLILTASLLEVLKDMTDEEVAGAEKMLIIYLNALTREANMARNASGVRRFQEVSLKIDAVVEQVKRHNYADAVKLVSEAISLVTTSGHHVAHALKEKGLNVVFVHNDTGTLGRNPRILRNTSAQTCSVSHTMNV